MDWLAALGEADFHDEALTRLALEWLAAGDLARARTYADQRCRRPDAGPADFMLRAEILKRLGFAKASRAAVLEAESLDPIDPLVLRALMSSDTPGARLRAAARIVEGEECEEALVIDALGALRAAGRPLAARALRRDRRIVGFAAWSGQERLDLSAMTKEGERRQTFAGDPAHPFAIGGSAVSFDLDLPTGSTATLRFTVAGATPLELAVPPSCEAFDALITPAPASARKTPGPVLAIVPVYGDFAATRACLASLGAQIAPFPLRIIVVDDASPDERLSAWLNAQERKGRFALIRNARNVGFAAAVNAALATRGSEDVVIVNADAWLPPGAIARLAQVAARHDGVGTVTPFSNNGELTSLPRPNVANPMPDRATIIGVDRAAARLNGLEAVDMPSGVGFCLFVTRACLGALPRLPEHYRRGYLEDADYCLRAAERGLRNICAPGVFVGHAGGRSFGHEKRALVVQNLRLLEARYPAYRGACAAFMAADPLRAFRARLERAAGLRRRRAARAA